MRAHLSGWIVVLALFASSATAQPPARPAEVKARQLKAKVLEAYSNTDTYQASCEILWQTPNHGCQMNLRGESTLTFDRQEKKLLFKRPDMTLSRDGQKLRCRYREYPTTTLKQMRPLCQRIPNWLDP